MPTFVTILRPVRIMPAGQAGGPQTQISVRKGGDGGPAGGAGAQQLGGGEEVVV